MKLVTFIYISSALIVIILAAPPNGYYNRRQFPPKYYYGHKGGFNSGPPINKYRPPGFRSTRNPNPGPGYQPVGQGINQPQPQYNLHHLPPQGPQPQYPLPQGFPQSGFPQGVPNSIRQPGIQQGLPHGPQQHQRPLFQSVPQHLQSGFPSAPPNRYTPIPQQHQITKSPSLPVHTNGAHWKNQPSQLNSIKEDYSQGPSFTAVTRTFYKPDDERSPIHTIPAPKLSPADRPADFEYKIQQTTPQQYQATPGFKLLNKAIGNQLKVNPNAYLLQQQQTKSYLARDPNVPQGIQVANDPFPQPSSLSNDKLPLDIYLQQQLDNEIAQQENLLLQKQKALEVQKYQQQLEAQLVLQAQQQAQALQLQHQEQIKQQYFQQQAVEAQRQLAIQAQQQQAAIQQSQYQAQQPAESLTAEELFNLMHGITPNNQPRNQPSITSQQGALLAQEQEQQQGNGETITGNFQPNYQSFNYNEKAHQEQNQQIQQQETQQRPETKEFEVGAKLSNINPQYQNFNYDEKTKRNGFTSEAATEVGQQILSQVDEATQNTSTRNQIRDIKKEKRYQKHIYPATQGYTVSYSTLPREVTENLQTHRVQPQSSFSTNPVNFSNEKQNIKKVKTNYNIGQDIKKQRPNNIKKRPRVPPNNGYSTIAEDLLQQHDLKNDMQHLTYSTLPNKKILEVLKNHRESNVTQRQPQRSTTEKDNLQKMRENAQKFYNPHILQAVRNSTNGADNVQIQQSIQIYETSYPSKSTDNNIDLSGMSTTSINPLITTTSTTQKPTSEPSNIVTEINIIENTGDSENQESNLLEEIMLQDESKPLEDNYNSNSHSYFGQKIRPKRT